MANQKILETNRETALRRVAIVLRSLPSEVAVALLGSIGSAEQQVIRRTMNSLADVDPLEQRRAIQAFKVSLQQPPSPASQPQRHSNEEVVSEPTSVDSNQPTSRVVSSPIATEPHEPSSPLSFLSKVDDDVVVGLLAIEHPQTIALVLASISAPHAARLLPRLDAKTQSDALSRVGRLGEIPPAAIAEIAEHFQKLIAQPANVHQRASGQRALHAILAELPPTASPPAHASDQRQTAPDQRQPAADRRRPAADRRRPAQQRTPATPPATATEPNSDAKFPSASVPAIDLSHKLRVAEHTWPAADPEAHHAPPEADSQRVDDRLAAQSQIDAALQELGDERQGEADQQASASSSELDSTDAIHAHLLQLEPLELCHALGNVETRHAMLALCGLPNQVAEAVFEVLPRAKAKQVRARMNSLGSLQLREIDEAKEIVARASVALLDDDTADVPLAA